MEYTGSIPGVYRKPVESWLQATKVLLRCKPGPKQGKARTNLSPIHFHRSLS